MQASNWKNFFNYTKILNLDTVFNTYFFISFRVTFIFEIYVFKGKNSPKIAPPIIMIAPSI